MAAALRITELLAELMVRIHLLQRSQQQTRFRYPGMKAPDQAEDVSGQQVR